MSKITETEFKRICLGIAEDRDKIIKHNPIGPDKEVLLWMLLSCLNSYLSLTEMEMPCFTGRPEEKTYKEAIIFILRGRTVGDFDPVRHMERMLEV